MKNKLLLITILVLLFSWSSGVLAVWCENCDKNTAIVSDVYRSCGVIEIGGLGGANQAPNNWYLYQGFVNYEPCVSTFEECCRRHGYEQIGRVDSSPNHAYKFYLVAYLRVFFMYWWLPLTFYLVINIGVVLLLKIRHNRRENEELVRRHSYKETMGRK
jgi:hypothetical protein